MSQKSLKAVAAVLFGLGLAVSPVFLVSPTDYFAAPSLLQYAGGGLLMIVGVGLALDARPVDGITRRAVASAGTLVALVGLLAQFVLS